MLTVIDYYGSGGYYPKPSLLVLGCFDAVHAGHFELLKHARERAAESGLDLGIMAFTCGKEGKLVCTFEERLEIFEKSGVKSVLKIDFDEEFKKTPCELFLKKISGKINIKGLMSGEDFRFGAGAKGNAQTLKNYALTNGLIFGTVEDVTFGGVKISTTLIKSLLEKGDVKTANTLLTRKFSVTGRVVSGAGRGNKLLGFPTMNVSYPEYKTEIKKGVYAVRGTLDGKVYKGIANYGARPTFGEENPLLEVYLIGFKGSCYGENLTVEFTDYIRDIKKFNSPAELCAQLEKDLRFAAEKERKDKYD